MAKIALILGESGSGKSRSTKNLPVDETFYVTGGTSGKINVSGVEAGTVIDTADINLSDYAQINTSTQSLVMRSNNNTAALNGTANGYYLEGLAQYHYTIDSRLGT